MAGNQDSIGKEISLSAKFYWRWISLLVAAAGLLSNVREDGLFGRPFVPFLRRLLDDFAWVTDLVFVPFADGIVWLAGLIGFSIDLGPDFKVAVLVFLPVLAAIGRHGVAVWRLLFWGAIFFALAVLLGVLSEGNVLSPVQLFNNIVFLLGAGGAVLFLNWRKRSALARSVSIDLLLIVGIAFAFIGLNYLVGD